MLGVIVVASGAADAAEETVSIRRKRSIMQEAVRGKRNQIRLPVDRVPQSSFLPMLNAHDHALSDRQFDNNFASKEWFSNGATLACALA